ncbi:hypothetical protein HMPREF9123_2646 [Neisseria bacilliformis ATCC BAA-1200]|uniref:Uncharacterized protein n=1 Tax=Neisseria bacilliformis ATCC BAA-1200 TaxID=888742 RepID=F2BFY9_9NEIS|nr:hypothetical protein HMPREF9123_2646 [Neisseria bacilliformis ATCC BAA-1200]
MPNKIPTCAGMTFLKNGFRVFVQGVRLAAHAVCGFGYRLNIPACAANNRPSENAVSVLPERFQTACCAVAYGSRVGRALMPDKRQQI